MGSSSKITWDDLLSESFAFDPSNGPTDKVQSPAITDRRSAPIALNSAIIPGCHYQQRITQGGCLNSVEVAMQQAVPSFAVCLKARLTATCLALVLITTLGGSALAFDCLAYKPERGQGQWHADVVSGKICWTGPNWRSFLPKPKARVENSQIANSKPKSKVVNRKPDVLVVKTEVENSKPDAQIENSQGDSQILKAENSKPDVRIENSAPATIPNSPLPEAVHSYRTQESSTVRKANPVEAAKFTNEASLESDHQPAISKTDSPGTSEAQSVTDLLIAFIIIAIGTVALVMLIMRAGSPQDITDTDLGEQPLEDIPVDDELAPPLQADSDEEHVVIKEPEHYSLD
jgi:hypothetical protein